eukprot:scaffold62740_cov27-Tisochrysis_lutea.AAC.1
MHAQSLFLAMVSVQSTEAQSQGRCYLTAWNTCKVSMAFMKDIAIGSAAQQQALFCVAFETGGALPLRQGICAACETGDLRCLCDR